MEKKKVYIVRWEELHSITIEAKNEQEAYDKVLSCDYDTSDESSEMAGDVEISEL